MVTKFNNFDIFDNFCEILDLKKRLSAKLIIAAWKMWEHFHWELPHDNNSYSESHLQRLALATRRSYHLFRITVSANIKGIYFAWGKRWAVESCKRRINPHIYSSYYVVCSLSTIINWLLHNKFHITDNHGRQILNVHFSIIINWLCIQNVMTFASIKGRHNLNVMLEVVLSAMSIFITHVYELENNRWFSAVLLCMYWRIIHELYYFSVVYAPPPLIVILYHNLVVIR